MRNLVLVCFFLVILGISGHCNAETNPSFSNSPKPGLQMDHYRVRGTCRDVENIVRELTWRNVSENPRLPAQLLRLHFHDCFVRGCDASVLLDSTQDNPSEKEAIPNLTIAGLDFIDFLKSKLEQACPGIVSCADIVALAARDAVSFQFRRSMWPVLTGREDGRISLENEANDGLPSPFSDFATLLQNFKDNKLDLVDLVALSGAHTLGVTHCSLVAPRLYNFTEQGGSDPTLDAIFAQILKTVTCPLPVDPNKALDMDLGSSESFDSHYFLALKQNKVPFTSDAALLTNPQAARIATQLQNPGMFFVQFAKSIVKMGGIGVLTGGKGEIRKNCRVVNH